MKTLNKKTFIHSAILSAMLFAGIAVANTDANQALTDTETKLVIADLQDELALEGIALSFPKGTPKLTYDGSINTMADIQPSNTKTTQKQKQQRLAELTARFAEEGISIDFGHSRPTLASLPNQLDEHDMNATSEDLYQKELTRIVTDMRASGSVTEAVEIYKQRTGNIINVDSEITQANRFKKLSSTETQSVMNMIESELEMEGLSISFNSAPAITIDQKKYLEMMNADEAETQIGLEAKLPTKLSRADKKALIADIIARLAEDGIRTNFDNNPPKITTLTEAYKNNADTNPAEYQADFKELMSAFEKEEKKNPLPALEDDAPTAEQHAKDADNNPAEYQAEMQKLMSQFDEELKQMATQVLNSVDVTKAVEILAEFESLENSDDIDETHDNDLDLSMFDEFDS